MKRVLPPILAVLALVSCIYTLRGDFAAPVLLNAMNRGEEPDKVASMRKTLKGLDSKLPEGRIGIYIQPGLFEVYRSEFLHTFIVLDRIRQPEGVLMGMPEAAFTDGGVYYAPPVTKVDAWMKKYGLTAVMCFTSQPGEGPQLSIHYAQPEGTE